MLCRARICAQYNSALTYPSDKLLSFSSGLVARFLGDRGKRDHRGKSKRQGRDGRQGAVTGVR